MGKLALTGGSSVATKPLGVKWPVWDERDRAALLEVLESQQWTRSSAKPEQSRVRQFEDAFAAFQNARHGLAVATGSSAIEVALQAVGVEPGDEVIVPAATFITVATAVVRVGAIPVFVDIDPDTYNIDVRAVEAAITPRTRAVLCVHNGGMPADLDALRALVQRHHLVLVGDCAHAHGSQWCGRGVGAIEDVGVFSFQGGKLLPAGEGGMVLTDDENLFARLVGLHHVNGVSGRPKPERALPATNLRMSEWIGALGLAGLQRLPEQVATRQENARYLLTGFQEIPGVEGIRWDPRVTRWSFYVWHWRFRSEEFGGVERDTFLAALRAEGVPAATGHTAPLYQHPALLNMDLGRTGYPFNRRVYGKSVDFRQVHCPQAERIAATEALSFSHPLFLGPRSDMDLVLDAIRKVRENVEELRGWEKQQKSS